MSAHPALGGPCLCPGCRYDSATRLGVCVGHWELLRPDLRKLWQDAWLGDGRTAVWLDARRACLAYLGDGDPAPIPY